MYAMWLRIATQSSRIARELTIRHAGLRDLSAPACMRFAQHTHSTRANQHTRTRARAHTLIKRPMHLEAPMQITDSAFCKKRAAAAAGLGVMLVEKGGAADEGGGDSPSSSAFLQLVGVLGRGRCGRAAAATGRGGQTRGRLTYVRNRSRRYIMSASIVFHNQEDIALVDMLAEHSMLR
jgi:hypothetical protein